MQLHAAALIGIFVTSYLLPGLGGNASIAFADPTAPKALPAEYRILAGILARPMDVASATTKPSPNLTEAIADAQACVMDLRKIHSTDDEINQLASIGIDATEDLTKRIEDLDVSLMSKPPRESTSTGAILPVVEAIVTHHPVVWLLHAFAQKANAQQNDQKKSWKDGVEAELAHIIDDSHQLEAAAMLLPKVATNYSAPESPNVGTITMRFVEAWGPLPVDVLELVNTGPELVDSTIEVELSGTNGESRKNIHFVPKWSRNGLLVARYSQGETVLDQTLNRSTVAHAQSVTVFVQSPNLSTRLSYTFNPTEQDKAVAEICKTLKLVGSYSEKKPLLGKSTYAASITLDGLAFIPDGQIELTLHRGTESKQFTYPFKAWKKGEAKTFPRLPFNPDSTDVVVSFPDTGYRYESKIGD